MTISLTDTLCIVCGICCDGVLFADVELAGRHEVSALEVLGLDVEDPDEDHHGLLLQPCGALHGTRCSIYAHRPECCRTFECRLLQEAQRGIVTIEDATATIGETLSRIVHIRALAASLGQLDERMSLKELCIDALASSETHPATPQVKRARNELESAMKKLEIVIRDTFL